MDYAFTSQDLDYFTSKIDEVRKAMPRELSKCIAPLDGTQFYWREGMEVNGRDGRLMLFRKKAYFDHRYSRDDKSRALVLPTMGHELCHKYQLAEWGYTRFVLTNNPVLRDQFQHPMCWAVEDFITLHFQLPKRDFR